MQSSEDICQLPLVPKAASARPFTLAIYVATLLLSALLIFAIQPMFAKMVLPRLGGSPSVWSVAMAVFQTALLIGYVYAHLLTRAFTPRRAAFVHLALLAIVAMTLPLGIAKGFDTPPDHWVMLWLVALFLASIGAPFIVLAASAPLLQNWFISTGHPHAANPYALYAASNLGSFAGLLAYPFLVEPLFPLQTQLVLWTAGFCALLPLYAIAATAASAEKFCASHPEIVHETRPSAMQCLSWTVLAAVPSALVIAVTAHISTDLAAAPFLWVLPLALYLLTFVVIFRDRPWVDHATVLRLLPYAVAPLAVSAFDGYKAFWSLVIALHLFVFVLIALACNGEVYRTRPHRSRLTDFYLWIAFGGAVGGIFAGLIAPNIFSSTYEYPILLGVALLVLPGMFEGGWQRFMNTAGPPLIAATILAALGIAQDLQRALGIQLPHSVSVAILFGLTAAMLLRARRVARYFSVLVLALLVMRLWAPGDKALLTARSFFGVHHVAETADRTHYLLINGTTVHGAEQVRDAAGVPMLGQPEPLTYYYPGSPISEAIEAARGAQPAFGQVAVIGLGAGSLACYRREGEQWTFFEIDPVVATIARDPKLFRFLSACAPAAPIVLGDGRLTLAATAARYDLIVLDAFSSDTIPVHLLTREAFGAYLSHLAPNGTIIAHLSNRHLELVSVVAAIAATQGLVAYVKYDRSALDTDHTYRLNSVVVALARNEADLGVLPAREGWHPAHSHGVAAWTDDYSNVLGALIR
jgi:spermidine synthase